MKDITAGTEIKSLFLVAHKEMRSTQNGLSLRLSDSSGSISALCPSCPSTKVPEFSVGDVIECSAKAVELNGKIQLELDPSSIRKLTTDEIKANFTDFIPKVKGDISKMKEELLGYVSGIKSPNLRELLQNFFLDGQFFEQFVLAPAAIWHHHNYAGGLLEHTLCVVKICDVLARAHPELDRDLLITGALLHDIGKMKEYAWTPRLEVTRVGGLVGHSVLGIEMVSARCPRDFPEELKLKIHHMIVAHHGRGEFGAAVSPRFAEAEALYYADSLDAKTERFIAEEERGSPSGSLGSGGSSEWTFSSLLGRYIYVGKEEEAK